MIKLCTILNVRSEEDITQKFEESASAYLKSDYEANEPIFDVTLQVKTENGEIKVCKPRLFASDWARIQNKGYLYMSEEQ